MKLNSGDPKALVEPEYKPDSIPEKKIIEKKQGKTRSDLGKTLAELKNGMYRLERLPED
jgi:hypothetical protein